MVAPTHDVHPLRLWRLAKCAAVISATFGLLADARLFSQELFRHSAVRIGISDDDLAADHPRSFLDADDNAVQQASLATLQPALPLTLPIRPVPEAPPVTTPFPRNPFGGPQSSLPSPSSRLTIGPWPGLSSVSGDEARGRVSSDAGSALFKSPAAIGTEIQRRNPIINDPRVRGSRVGSMAASGSYWIPARIDLDTPISKIDSRILDTITVVPGPYNVLNGPGLQTIEFDLLAAPRFEDGPEIHGSTSADYLVNGQQFYGRQDVWGGSEAWGFRAGYGHRTGNDYQTGSGTDIPSSYNSRDVNLGFGADLSPDSHLHFSYLRIDQTGVELPGQAFDISYLSTDAYGVDYVLENQPAYDQLTASAWYNRTRLIGDAQRPGKRRQFPFLDAIQFVGNTDVDATSTGYRLATAWESPDDWRLIVGTDLRFVNQELNEIISGQSGINRFIDVNSPIPDSDWVNPGIFVQHQWYATDQWSFRVGARADEVATRIVDDPSKLAEVGTTGRPYAEIVGTTVEDRSLGLWAAFASANYQPVEDWSISLQMGRAERAPSLTELYVAQSFMFLIQNGLNTITGDPLLRAEKLWQMDITLAHQGDRLHGVVRGFHNWVHDYITYENLGIVENDDDEREQVNLKYVNTNLATFTGVEMLADYRWTDGLTPFGTLQYVRAQDLTRNGDFATRQASFVRPSTRDYTRNRGAFGGAPTNAAEEPLPQISPLQSKLGIRLHSPDPIPWWAIEIYARVVGPQNRVAVSLHESPTAGFAVGDIRAYLRPSDSWIVVGGIENFTDRNYREHLDFRSEGRGLTVFQPGINFYSGVELRY